MLLKLRFLFFIVLYILLPFAQQELIVKSINTSIHTYNSRVQYATTLLFPF